MPAPTLSATHPNRRAVSGNCSKTLTCHIFNILVQVKFINPSRSFVKSANSKSEYDHRLAPKSNQPASPTLLQACFFSLIPGLCMAQLTSNTDSIIKKLVTVFVLVFYSFDNFVILDYPDRTAKFNQITIPG